MKKKIKNFIKLITNNNLNNSKLSEYEGMIQINNEDHTLGNLIARGMQQHENIKFAGYNLPHPLTKKVIFHYHIKENTNIKNILKDVVDYYSNIFDKIKKKIETTI